MDEHQPPSAIAEQHRALDDLYRKHFDRLHRSVRARVNPKIAEDIVQEAFKVVYEAMKRGRGPEDPQLYLRRVVSNLVAKSYEDDRLRSKYEPAGHCLADEMVPDPAAGVDDFLEVIGMACLKGLTLREREAYWYQCAEDLPRKEIAEIMQVSIKTVDNLLARARKKIAVQQAKEQAS